MNHLLLKKKARYTDRYALFHLSEGFYKALNTVSKLEMPIIVTENGIADDKDDEENYLSIDIYMHFFKLCKMG